ncbi:MAG: hypothetical protein KAR11_01535, partial [Phycisphaerae bacterium]|nr:hypothetical protein [Phycisphaerae bacterium]
PVILSKKDFAQIDRKKSVNAYKIPDGVCCAQNASTLLTRRKKNAKNSLFFLNHLPVANVELIEWL